MNKYLDIIISVEMLILGAIAVQQSKQNLELRKELTQAIQTISTGEHCESVCVEKFNEWGC